MPMKSRWRNDNDSIWSNRLTKGKIRENWRSPKKEWRFFHIEGNSEVKGRETARENRQGDFGSGEKEVTE